MDALPSLVELALRDEGLHTTPTAVGPPSGGGGGGDDMVAAPAAAEEEAACRKLLLEEGRDKLLEAPATTPTPTPTPAARASPAGSPMGIGTSEPGLMELGELSEAMLLRRERPRVGDMAGE